jgi:hypothetical protein
MAEDMLICGLRAGFASLPESNHWVLHDPRAWLGIAFHSLLQQAGQARSAIDLEAAWNSEIKRLANLAAGHQFDRRFSDPTRWPSYYLVRQRALSSAHELISKRALPNSVQPAPDLANIEPSKTTNRGIERRLVARSGRLAGRPDRFDRSAITDFKSSLPDVDAPKRAEILARHERQMRIYAAIIAEVFGYWPKTGILAAASGATISIDLDPKQCNAEAEIALAALDKWNGSLLAAGRADELAAPSASACENCRYQLICPAFWGWIMRGSEVSLHGTSAAIGTLVAVQSGNDRDLQTLQFSNTAASYPAESDQSIVIRGSVHGDNFSNVIGATCRITGASVRQDGRLHADLSTIVASENELPSIEIGHEVLPEISADEPEPMLGAVSFTTPSLQ